jgi:hypothetical protein
MSAYTTFKAADAAIESILSGDSPVKMATVDKFAATINRADVTSATMAYAVRERGIVGIESKESLTTLAAKMSGPHADDKTVQSTRSRLSQYASVIGWAVKANLPVTADVFTTGRTLYGRGASARTAVTGTHLPAIVKMTEEADRLAAWHAMLGTVTSAPRAPRVSTGDKGDTGADKGAGEDKGDATSFDGKITRAGWFAALDMLAANVSVLGVVGDAKRAHIAETLETIATALAPADANA